MTCWVCGTNDTGSRHASCDSIRIAGASFALPTVAVSQPTSPPMNEEKPQIPDTAKIRTRAGGEIR